MCKRKFSFEIKRKLLHLSSVGFPIIYYNTSKIIIVIILLCFFSIFVSIDILRYNVHKIQALVKKFFDSIIRDEEKHNFRLTGATYMLMSMFVTAMLFSKFIAITSWVILIISDTSASLVGKNFGKKTIFRKSLLGSISFFFSSLIIVYILSYIFNFSTNILHAMICCLITTIFEFFSSYLKIDDNLGIPIIFSSCFAISINY